MEVFTASSLRVHLLRLATLVLAASSLLAIAVPAHAEDLGLAAAPAANGGVDNTRSRFTYQVQPGQSLNDQFFVKNTGTQPQTVTVYATDAFNSDAGEFALLDTGAPPVDAGSWVTFGSTPTQFVLQPDESKILDFTVNVPADAAPGDHAGGIVLSAMTDSGQVRLDRRVATRMYVRVAGELQGLLNLSNIASSYAPSWNPFDGTLDLTFTLKNTGNVAMGANAVVTTATIFGIPVRGSEKIEVPELLPGTSRSVTMSLTGVGQWVYLLSTIDLAGVVDQDAYQSVTLPMLTRDAVTWVVPWAFLLLALIAAAVWFILRQRKRINAKRLQEWQEYEALQRGEPSPTPEQSAP